MHLSNASVTLTTKRTSPRVPRQKVMLQIMLEASILSPNNEEMVMKM